MTFLLNKLESIATMALSTNKAENKQPFKTSFNLTQVLSTGLTSQVQLPLHNYQTTYLTKLEGPLDSPLAVQHSGKILELPTLMYHRCRRHEEVDFILITRPAKANI